MKNVPMLLKIDMTRSDGPAGLRGLSDQRAPSSPERSQFKREGSAHAPSQLCFDSIELRVYQGDAMP